MLLQVSAINAAMSSLVKTLNVFPRERTIVTRERSKKARDALLTHNCLGPREGHRGQITHSDVMTAAQAYPLDNGQSVAVTCMQAYDVLPYFGAKLAAELPVGAVFPLLFGAVVYPLTGLNPRPSRSAESTGSWV